MPRAEGRDPRRQRRDHQERAGTVVAVPHARARDDRCAVHALRVWLDAANVPSRTGVPPGCTAATPSASDGLTDQSVALISNAEARPGSHQKISRANSLRAGSQPPQPAAGAGVEERKIANVTRGIRTSHVLRRYVRAATGVRRRRRSPLAPPPLPPTAPATPRAPSSPSASRGPPAAGPGALGAPRVPAFGPRSRPGAPSCRGSDE